MPKGYPSAGARERATGADHLADRVRVAVRTLLAGGHPVDANVVIRGAGLEFHRCRDAFAGWVPTIEKEMGG